MTVWMSKRDGRFVLAWQVYENTVEPIRNETQISYFWQSGWAVQNKYGVTFLFNDGWQSDFEYIGEF